MNSPDGFQDLVSRAQAGDRQAMDQLLAVIRPWLEQLARGYADPRRPDESTSDLAQEAWLRAWQKLDQFRGGGDDEQTRARFRAWLSQIVHRLGLNALRGRQTQRRKPPGKRLRVRPAPADESASQNGIEPAASGPTPSANMQAEEQMRRIRGALQQIADTTDREIVRLRFFEGWSLRQIARHLHTNQEQVRQRYHAVMEQLERELRDLL